MLEREGALPAVLVPARPTGPTRLELTAGWLAPAAYLVIGAALLRFYRFIYNKDEISYISVARRYADGDLADAVNSYWAPMLSWLLAPLLLLDLDTGTTAKALGLGIGLLAFLGVWRLSSSIGVSPGVRVLLSVLLVPIVLSWALSAFTPDLLQAGLLLLYLSVVADRRYPFRRWAGVAGGALGAMLFFSKSYGFPFFLLHFPLVNLGHALVGADRATRRAVLARGLAGMAVFFLLAGAWGALLGQKYGSFTFGVGGSYNYSIVGPDSPGRPIFYFGFVPPQLSAVTSVWEEPAWFAERLESWSPIESRATLAHQTRLVAVNARATVEDFQEFSMLSPAILLMALLMCLVPRRRFPSRVPLVFWMASMALFCGGYTLVHSEERYLWGVLLVSLVIGGHLLSVLFDTDLFAHRGRAAVLAGAFAVALLLHPAVALQGRANRGRGVNAIADQLRDAALNEADMASSDDYGAANVVAFRLGARYWGQPPTGTPEAEVVNKLRANSIRYYLIWNHAPQPTDPAFTMVRDLRADDQRLALYAVS